MGEKIGIIGTGVVGKTLAKGFLKHGYEVMVGTRNPERMDELLNETHEKFNVGSPHETAMENKIIILAVKGNKGEEALKSIGEEALDNKIVIDATNPISDDQPQDGVLKYFTDINHSLMESYQKKYPKTHFVKAFSSVGNAHMVNPEFEEGKPTMFICGNSDEAKDKTTEILEKFGFDVADMGKATAARAIEPLAMLWCIPGFLNNEWGHAFKLLRR